MTKKSGSEAIQYFNENAEALCAFYSKMDRAKVHADLIPLLPEKKLVMLDVGAGSGADANFFSKMGHQVVAAEPAEDLAGLGQEVFSANNNIIWSDDKLPEMKNATSSFLKFDVVYSVGALQYTEDSERQAALAKMAELTADDGLIEIQYPTPPTHPHQHNIKQKEIVDFVDAFNKASKDGRKLEIIVNKSIPAMNGRKALNGEDLYFNITIIKSLKP